MICHFWSILQNYLASRMVRIICIIFCPFNFLLKNVLLIPTTLFYCLLHIWCTIFIILCKYVLPNMDKAPFGRPLRLRNVIIELIHYEFERLRLGSIWKIHDKIDLIVRRNIIHINHDFWFYGRKAMITIWLVRCIWIK